MASIRPICQDKLSSIYLTFKFEYRLTSCTLPNSALISTFCYHQFVKVLNEAKATLFRQQQYILYTIVLHSYQYLVPQRHFLFSRFYPYQEQELFQQDALIANYR